MFPLDANAFEQLLARLDPVQEKAAEKYEILRVKLVKALTWKGCPESRADELADIVLDRMAMKIAGGEKVDNMNAYSQQVLRFVWLEQSRKNKEDTAGDDLPEVVVQPDIEILNDPDVRMRCLRKCLAEVIPDGEDRKLIVGYYDTASAEKNKESRKNLADKFDLTMTNLKVKACRLRNRLEACIIECVERLNVTKTPDFDTNTQRGTTK